MTAILERDASLVDLFQSALGSGASVLGSLDALNRHLAEQPQEHAVVLGPSVTTAEAVGVAERYRVVRPSLSVILVRARVDTAVLTEALRAGIREVVESRDLSSLTVAVRRAHELWQAMSSGAPLELPAGGSERGMLVTSFSTKGGVGKSVVATNVAAAMAAGGKRVCLVDLDVQDGDVAIMLQVLPARTLADLTSVVGAVDRTSVESLLLQHSENLTILAAPPRVNATDRLSPDAVGRVLVLLKEMFDVVIVDTSGGFDDYGLQALDHSDLVLLLGTLDIPALKSVKVATETLKLLNIPTETLRLVLNRADAKVGLAPTDFEQTLDLRIAASLPSCREVPASVNAGHVMVTAHPRHPFSQGIRALAQSLDVPRPEPAAASPVTRPGSRKLLRRKAGRS